MWMTLIVDEGLARTTLKKSLSELASACTSCEIQPSVVIALELHAGTEMLADSKIGAM